MTPSTVRGLVITIDRRADGEWPAQAEALKEKASSDQPVTLGAGASPRRYRIFSWYYDVWPSPTTITFRLVEVADA